MLSEHLKVLVSEYVSPLDTVKDPLHDPVMPTMSRQMLPENVETLPPSDE
jgi:hypothetical protein